MKSLSQVYHFGRNSPTSCGLIGSLNVFMQNSTSTKEFEIVINLDFCLNRVCLETRMNACGALCVHLS